MNFKCISQILVAKLLVWLSLFKHMVRGGKALLYKGYKYLKLPDGKEWQEWLPMNHYREGSAFHVCHNLEQRCTCSFVHVVMQRFTVDFMGRVDSMGVDPVGSWYIGSWFSGSWFFESWSRGRTPHKTLNVTMSTWAWCSSVYEKLPCSNLRYIHSVEAVLFRL